VHQHKWSLLGLPWNVSVKCECRLLRRFNKPGNAFRRVCNCQRAADGRNKVLLQQPESKSAPREFAAHRPYQKYIEIKTRLTSIRYTLVMK